MPKHESMTPKAIANKIKSKGLQKLRWYCQMCQKQCRDENGFKCHVMSESHQRQLLLVADNPGKFVGNFSDEFLKGFMDILRRQYGTRRVHCNVVYQEYIRDKDHYHMNATRWSTLTGFVMWLGRQGLCDVEPTPKGWYITYIDRSPEALEREASDKKKVKMDRDDEERTQQMIEDQIVRATALKKCNGEMDEDGKANYTELKRKDENEKITLTLFGSKTTKSEQQQHQQQDTSQPMEVDSKSDSKPERQDEEEPTTKKMKLEPPADPELPSPPPPAASKAPALPITGVPNPLKIAELEAKSKKSSKVTSSSVDQDDKKKKTFSTLDKVFKIEEERREKMNRRDYWLHVGIIVKILNKKLGDKIHKKKGVIEELHDQYTATVRMLDTREKLKLDQSDLESVIPAIGREVLVVNGAYRGYKAKLEDVDMDNYSVSVTIQQGPSRGRYVEGIAYEDVSKICTKSFPFAR